MFWLNDTWILSYITQQIHKNLLCLFPGHHFLPAFSPNLFRPHRGELRHRSRPAGEILPPPVRLPSSLPSLRPLRWFFQCYLMQRIHSSSEIQNNVSLGNGRLDNAALSKLSTHLKSLSRGSYLYLKLTLDLIERGYLVLKSSSFKVRLDRWRGGRS